MKNMKFKVLLASSLLFCTALQAQEMAKGVVFHDSNKNGKLDGREKGLPGVSVSNGTDVVLTNAKGEYQLPVANDNIIFVVKPRDYVFPTDKNNLPQFYYIHKPQGSPALKYKATSATGAIPKKLNFPLYESEEGNDFKAFVFGDPQAYNLDEIAYFRKGIVDDITAKDSILFGISLGDLVGDDLVLHQPYQEAVGKIGLPWYNVMGNHDMNFDVTVDSLSDETYEANFGPNNFAFNYGNAHFIILDNILYPNPRTGKGYLGGFRKDQLDFVENNLKFVPKDKLIVLAFHIPLKHKNSNVFRNEDRQRLFDLLKDYPNTVSLSAHTHFQEQIFYTKEDGWRQDKPHHEYNVGTTSGDWYSGAMNAQGVPASTMRDGTPKGYAILSVKDNQYSFDYKVAGEAKDYQIKINAPSEVSKRYVRRHFVSVNFFMGKEGDQVEYRFGEGDWKAMNYKNAADPGYTYEVLKYDLNDKLVEGKKPSNPVNSTHLWEFKMPNLSVGTHTLEIRAKDMYGKVHTASKTIQVIQ